MKITVYRPFLYLALTGQRSGNRVFLNFFRTELIAKRFVLCHARMLLSGIHHVKYLQSTNWIPAFRPTGSKRVAEMTELGVLQLPRTFIQFGNFNSGVDYGLDVKTDCKCFFTGVRYVTTPELQPCQKTQQ